MEKVKNQRNEDFKKKSSSIDKRSLRAHRRSIEWKQMRDQTVNSKRPTLNDLSPLTEVQQNKQEKSKAESRKEMLERWKREKELKRKLESQKNAHNKPFKVVKSNSTTDTHLFKKDGNTTSLSNVSKASSGPANRTRDTSKPTRVTRPVGKVSKDEKKSSSTTARAASNSVRKPAGSSLAPARATRQGTSARGGVVRPASATRDRHTATTSTAVVVTSSRNKPSTASATVAPSARNGRRGAVAKKETNMATKVPFTRSTRSTAKETNRKQAPATKASKPAASKATAVLRANSKPATEPEQQNPFTDNDVAEEVEEANEEANVEENVDDQIPSEELVTENPSEGVVTEIASEVTPKSILKSARKATTMDNVNAKRGSRFVSSDDSESDQTRGSGAAGDLSFAPRNFQFQAPANLAEFDFTPRFTPLSPASTARFLMPSAEGIASPPGEMRRCSTPKLGSVKAPPVLNSLHTSVIREANSATSSSDSDASGPVLVLQDKLTSSARRVRNASRNTEAQNDYAANSTRPIVVKSVSFDANTKQPAGEQEEGEEEEETPSPSRAEPRTRKQAKTRAAVTSFVENSHLSSSSSALGVAMDTEEGGDAVAMETSKEEKKDATNELEKSGSDGEGTRNDATFEIEHQKSGKVQGSHSLPEDVLAAATTSGGTRRALRNATATGANKENVVDSSTQNNENHDRVGNLETLFKTPEPPTRRRERKHKRALSLGRALSARKTPKNNRTSLILRNLSPEEGVEVLRHSPMVELTRRTLKARLGVTPRPGGVGAPLALPCFDDLDEAMEQQQQQQGGDGGMATDAPATAQSDDVITNVETTTQNNDVTSNLGDDKANVEGSVTAQSDDVSSGVHPALRAPSSHDVPYFRLMLTTETSRLRAQCDTWRQVMEAEQLSEEACGLIRTAVGKAELLVSQRFRQFSGLVDNCEFNTGEKPTTCTDLQGFWDMVYFQVEDVDRLFYELSELQERGWQPLEQPKQPAARAPVRKKPAAKTKAKLAAKSKFAAFRAQLQKQNEVVEAEEESCKTFEGGFFKVQSPVRSPAPHCTDEASRRSLTAASCSPLLRVVVTRQARRSHALSPLLAATMSQNDEKKTENSTDSESTPRRSTRSKPQATCLESNMDVTPAENSATTTVTVPDQAKGHDLPSSEVTTNDLCDVQGHDVPYFRSLLLAETERLRGLCAQWQHLTEASQLPEHVCGLIRTAVGKAVLLVSQRFRQFSELVDNCEFNTGEKPTTCTDLQGFWDMVYFQVEDVQGLFAALEKLQQNNWTDSSDVSSQDNRPAKKKVVKKPAAKKKAPTGKSNYAAFRAQMKKEQEPEGEEPVVGVATESEVAPPIKTFEAGFFCVTSPVRSPWAGARLQVTGDSQRRKRMSGTPLHRELLLRNAMSRTEQSSPHHRHIQQPASPRNASKRKATTVTADEPEVPVKVKVQEGQGGTPTLSPLRRSHRRCVAGVESSGGLGRLLAATSSTPEQLAQAREGSLFTPESGRKSRPSTRLGVARMSVEETGSVLDKLLVPSASPDTCEMEYDEVTSPPDDVNMAARMKRALIGLFNADKSEASSGRRSGAHARSRTRTTSGGKQLSPGNATPSQMRRLSVLKQSGRKSRPSTPYSKPLSRRHSSARRSVDTSALLPEMSPPPITSLAATAVGGNTDSPASLLEKLSVAGSPAVRAKTTHRRQTRRVSAFTPPPAAPSPTHLAAVTEHDDLMGFSPALSDAIDVDSATANKTPKRARRASTNKSRRVSGFTPPERTASPGDTARLPSVREQDDLIAFSPLPATAHSDDAGPATPRHSRRSIRRSVVSYKDM